MRRWATLLVMREMKIKRRVIFLSTDCQKQTDTNTETEKHWYTIVSCLYHVCHWWKYILVKSFRGQLSSLSTWKPNSLWLSNPTSETRSVYIHMCTKKLVQRCAVDHQNCKIFRVHPIRLHAWNTPMQTTPYPCLSVYLLDKHPQNLN